MKIQEWIFIGLALFPNGASFYLLKRICLLVILGIVAVIDWKKYRIPNKSIIIAAWIKVLIIILEIVYKKFVIQELLLEILAAMFLLGSCAVCRFLMKNSIGAGDVKLLVIMALYLGWQDIWSAVFLSLIVFLVMGAVLLVTKKKTKGDPIPFGPAFAIGTYLSFF